MVEEEKSLSLPNELLAKDTGNEQATSETVVAKSAVTKTAVVNNGASKNMTTDTGIMEFTSSLADAEAPPPLPAGEYPATIVKAEFKTSATSGNKYLAIMFKIDPEHYPADYQEGNPDGETFSYNRVVMNDTPQGRYRIRKFLEAVGASLGSTLNPNDLMQLTASVTITHDKWEGEDRAQIAKVTSA